MQITSPAFKSNATEALADPFLQKAMGFVRTGFIDKRKAAIDALPEFEALRDSAKAIKDHTLAHLDLYLEAYCDKVEASGGHVHFAETAQDARDIILKLCRDVGREDRDQGQEHGHRGDRAQPAF